jgi:hypothetical protein
MLLRSRGMRLLEQLRGITTTRRLAFLLIGGHAVNVHGYSRMTEDVDILVRGEELEEWKAALLEIGYGAVEEHGAFCQFNCADAKTGRLDLMLVNNSTFEKLQARARQVQYLGKEIAVVAVEHLIALKLHALKQELPHRAIKDFLDVVELIRANHLDLKSAEMQEIFVRYATPDLARRIRIACE